jgi:hypothetical protein
MVLSKELVTPARRAVAKIIEGIGISSGPAEFLHISRHISFHLPHLGTVARVRPLSEAATLEGLERELKVILYLLEQQAPVVPPDRRFPPKAHVADGFAMTFWTFIKHKPFDDEQPRHREAALASLELLHAAFRDYPGQLPDYRHKIFECRTLLHLDDRLSALTTGDRGFLKALLTHLLSRLDAFDIEDQPIHGDVHPENIFVTPAGILWSDFEAASRGPAEWDICGLVYPDEDPGCDDTLFSLLGDLKSFCVSIWCWDLAQMPEKLEAAQYHLGRLKTRYPQLL